jgi:translation initiation factor IF-2
MNDRVRVYDLARQMNVNNQVLIDTLRELGYNIKSHSSTIDAHVVTLLIDALNKKKQSSKSDQSMRTLNSESKSESAVATKSAPTKIEPPAPVVKPRVLSRRKPVAPTSDVPAPQEEMPVQTPAIAAAATPQVATPPAPLVSPVSPPAPPAPPVSRPADAEHSKNIITEPEPKISAAPSVPIRVAAPSIRATPPRPPRSHRQATPPERHIQQRKEEKSVAAAVAVEVPRIVVLSGALTVTDLAQRMNVPETEIIKRLFMKGFMRTVNQLVELELAKELAVEMEYEIQSAGDTSAEPMVAEKPELSESEQAALITRPPVVTIMGHVDHGKTSLLDAIRQTKFSLTASEAGGITQHIGAYHVEVPGENGQLRQVVFLDTPGHEAFTAMRARGAKVTDIAILVVAADDGVMPQTAEAIDHAKAAGVPIVVAINKIDKPDANPDRVLGQLMEHNVVSDRLGGDTVTVNVSAKNRTGLDELLEMVLLVADIQDLKANPDRSATGIIIEAELSRGKGAVATALVQTGTLREGDVIVAGNCSGRVRALLDDRGQRVKAAGPSMPVEVLGLDEVPQAGDPFEIVTDPQTARSLVERRKLLGSPRMQHVTLESVHALVTQGAMKDLNVIIKADVQGTAEAIADQVRRLATPEVQVKVVHTASGAITENDVNLAASANAIVIGFNVEPDPNANRVKETAGVDIRSYKIIYQITEDLEKAIQGLIEPVREEVEIGAAEVRQIFKFSKSLTIAGCYVTTGKIQRGAIAKVEREGEIVYDGKIETLKRFKDDAKEVAQGFECGMAFEKFNDMREGDIIHCSVIQEVKP